MEIVCTQNTFLNIKYSPWRRVFSNYRGIALLRVLWKVISRVLEGKIKQEMDRWIGVVSAVMQVLYRRGS